MNACSHLPNARHIDWVLASAKKHPKIWSAARDAAWDASWDAAWVAARDEAWSAIWRAARDVAWDAAVTEAMDAPMAVAAAWDVIAALIAYDDCAHLLDMPSDRLKIWAVLSEQPAAVLLLSAVIAREQISELNMA